MAGCFANIGSAPVNNYQYTISLMMVSNPPSIILAEQCTNTPIVSYTMQPCTRPKSTDCLSMLIFDSFLVAYGLFEVPSNILLKKLRPSRWIAFLMFGWGALTVGLGGVHSYAAVTVVRFLLGVFEAGLFPGLVSCRPCLLCFIQHKGV